jgi:scyllo-inositol 2-dehydrogenase (NADP+)
MKVASKGQKIRIGLVGLGWVSTHRHLPALKRDPRFEIVGLADRDGDLAQLWARRLGIPNHCAASKIEEIAWVDHADAIDVVTSPMSHYALIRDALVAGKHVITEKPFAMSIAEGEELVELARAAERQLAIVHNFQFASSTKRLLHDMKTGSIGNVRSIIATQWGNPRRRLPVWYEQLPGGLFFDESPHLLYLIRRLSPGKLRMVGLDSCPSTQGLHTPASIDASFRAAGVDGDIPVSVSCRFEAPLSEWHVAVLGDEAAGIIDVFRDVYLRLPNDGAHVTSTVLRTSLYATWMHWKAHVRNGPLHLAGRLLYGNDEVFARFGRAIQGEEPLKDISGADALDVLRMQMDIVGRLPQQPPGAKTP